MSNKAQKRGLIPKLRFHEFRDAGEWVEKPVGRIATLRNGFAFKSSTYIDNGRYKVITIGNVQAGALLTEDAKTISDLPRDIQFHQQLQISDILISMTGNVGRICCVDVENCLLNQRVGKLVLHGANNAFFYQSLNNDRFREAMQSKAAGGAQGNLSSSAIEEYVLFMPQEDGEQQKIADCLASLDERITLEAKKLDTLKTHKKGLMQQLFPAEGETLPKLRFPEFRDAGEWEKKLIEDFFDVGSSKRVLQQDWTTQGVPFYRTRELVSLSKNEPFGSEIFISEALFREISENYGLPTEGDFLISGVGTLGVSYQVQAQDRFYFKDGNVLWFKAKGGVDSTFFKYCFEADEIQNQIMGQASISTVGTYTIQNAKVTKFTCSPSIDEQQKIAVCLTSIDDLITAQTQKLTALKTHKKGLMQQLFPSVGGVAGEA